MKSPRLFPIQIILSSGRLWLNGILRIKSSSKGRKVALTMSTLHHFVTGSMREETIGNWGILFGGEITLYVDGVGSHLSSHIWINFPFPTLHRVPFLITPRLLWMLLQEYEGELTRLAFRISPVGKYLALRTLATREFGFWRICHNCFVESLQNPEAHASLSFRLTHCFPTDPIQFRFLLPLTPPEVPHHAFDVIT